MARTGPKSPKSFDCAHTTSCISIQWSCMLLRDSANGRIKTYTCLRYSEILFLLTWNSLWKSFPFFVAFCHGGSAALEVNSFRAGGVATLSLQKRLLQMVPVQCLSEI